MNILKISITLAIVFALAVGVSKYASLQVGAKALETITSLKEENAAMKNKIVELERGLLNANSALAISEAQTKELSAENTRLKKISEERVRKVWSMYDPDT